jgi:hypothetical protein
MHVGYMPKAKGMMPNMLGMPRMSFRLARGMPRGTSNGGVMVVIWQGWRIRMGDNRCRALDEAKNHGSASNANYNVRDGDCCSYKQVWIACKDQIDAWLSS